MSNDELRILYCKRTEREKQRYIAKVTGIDASILSKFKLGKIDLYPHLLEKLESYLVADEN